MQLALAAYAQGARKIITHEPSKRVADRREAAAVGTMARHMYMYHMIPHDSTLPRQLFTAWAPQAYSSSLRTDTSVESSRGAGGGLASVVGMI